MKKPRHNFRRKYPKALERFVVAGRRMGQSFPEIAAKAQASSSPATATRFVFHEPEVVPLVGGTSIRRGASPGRLSATRRTVRPQETPTTASLRRWLER